MGDIVAEPVDPVTANSSPSSKTPSPSLSTKAKASDNGPLMALIETGAILSELPPKLQADNTDARLMKDAVRAFFADISFFIEFLILLFKRLVRILFYCFIIVIFEIQHFYSPLIVYNILLDLFINTLK